MPTIEKIKNLRILRAFKSYEKYKFPQFSFFFLYKKLNIEDQAKTITFIRLLHITFSFSQ